MSEMLTPDHSPPDLQSPPAKPQRILACVLCQQRKVRCDRKFPCANCTKAGVQCQSAALVQRQRRRRFPERELLERMREYEELLRRNQIQFEPLHSSVTSRFDEAGRDGVGMALQEMGDKGSGEKGTEQVKNFWHAMNRKSQHPANDDETGEADANDDAEDSDSSTYVLREKVVRNAWDELFPSDDALLFCSRNTSIDLAALHPNQIHIFKIWQIYLENFNPLLKVTHTPTLQPRIIDAAGDVANIDPPLEALMFSIYCVSIFSLDETECQKTFSEARGELLSRYQLGAREALLKCAFLRTDNRECLTALHFYLMTTRTETDPRSLSSMLGIAIRTAQRMGIHDEGINRKHDALEAELRRRLWWSLVLFDARIAEMTDFRLGFLLPTWDCKLPLNANDFNFQPGMKNPPEVHGVNTESLFVVVRGEIGDFLRHCSFHLDFINPALKSVARPKHLDSNAEGDDLAPLQRILEDKYLRYCDPQNPLHFMTIWWARGQLAKMRFLKYLASCSKTSTDQTDTQRDTGISYALALLDCDTKILSSKLTKGFNWLIYLNFPFPAYVHVVQDLKKRPLSDRAVVAWNTMSENCAARFIAVDGRDKFMEKKENPFFKIFAGVVFQAWAKRTEAMGPGNVETPPQIVTQISERMAKVEVKFGGLEKDGGMDAGGDAGLTMGMGDMGGSFDMEQGFGSMDNAAFGTFPEHDVMGLDVQSWGWPAAHMHPMFGRGW